LEYVRISNDLDIWSQLLLVGRMECCGNSF
jgi:hypothetical protein